MNTNLHISIILATFSEGGSQSVMVDIANGLAELGYKVDIVTVKAVGPFLEKVKSIVTIVDLKTQKVSHSIGAFSNYIKQKQPNIIISTQKHTNIIISLARYITKNKAKLILRASSTPSEDYKRGNWLVKLSYWLAYFIYPLADYYIGQCKGASQDFKQFYGINKHKIHTINNPIINKELFEKAEQPCHHAWFAADTPIILSMGRIHFVKDFATLIKAFAKVREKCVCRLVIVGKGNEAKNLYHDELLQLIRDLKIEADVLFLGFQKNPFPYVKRANVYVQSSLYEGLPGSLIQALALGCKIVSTDCPNGPREILADGKYGSLVPIGTIDKMATAILDKLQNKSNSNIVDVSKYSKPVVIKEYQALIEQI